MVMSCDINDDLLVPENWSFSEPVKFDHFVPEIADLQKPVMTIEGTLVEDPDGKFLNIMRFGKRGYNLAYEVNTVDHEAPLSYHSIKKIGVAYVSTAIALNDAQKDRVKQRLLETTAYESFEMNYTVDETLLGGMVIRVGDRVVDTSIKNKLRDLSKQLSAIHVG
jgi:hypothetical protein